MSKDKNQKKVKETNSGVRAEGDLHDVAEVAEEVEKVMDSEENISEDSVKKFNDWRPRREDKTRDIKEKTVEKAAIDKKDAEKESNGVKEDLSEAKEDIKKKKEPEKVVKASKKATRPFMSKLFSNIRKMEKILYSKLMLRFNPYFFDSTNVSADIREKRNGDYRMDVNMTESQARENLQSNLKDKEEK